MREHNKRRITRPILIALLAFALVAGSGIGTAWAFFTTYATAKGSYTLKLGDRSEIEEDVVEGRKEVVISVTEDSQPVFIRARGFGGEEYKLAYESESGNWTENKEDGFWYYKLPVEAKGKTDKLTIHILDKDGKKIDASQVEDGTKFNVVVVYETTPAIYEEDGTASADWTSKVKKYQDVEPVTPK